MPDERRRIPAVKDGKWSTVEDPIVELDGDWREGLSAQGWELFHDIEGIHEELIQVWNRYELEDYLVVVDTFCSWRTIYAADFPSMLDAVARADSFVSLTLQSRRLELFQELHELLTQYGAGPLADCLDAKQHKEWEQRTRRAREKAAKEPQATPPAEKAP